MIFSMSRMLLAFVLAALFGSLAVAYYNRRISAKSFVWTLMALAVSTVFGLYAIAQSDKNQYVQGTYRPATLDSEGNVLPAQVDQAK